MKLNTSAEHGESRSGNGISTAPHVLLTDTNRWPSPARLAIGLSKVGCRVSAICPTGHPLLFTRAVERTFHYSSLRPLEALTAAIEATKPQIVIPCDDRGVQHLHELFDAAVRQGTSERGIAALIERSLGSPEGYPVVSSRYALLEVARQEGLRVPATCAVHDVADLTAWLRSQPLPWVIKADGTFGGRGVRIAQTREEGDKFFRELNRPHRTMRVLKRMIVNRDPFWVRPWWQRSRAAIIAQAYVAGRPANCAFLCWKGKVLGWIGVEVISSEAPTGPATIVRVVDNPEMITSSEKLARRLNLSGLYGLDFILENGGRSANLIEMNPRCTPLCHLQLGNGRDMVGALWAKLSGSPRQDTPPITQNPMIAYFPQAWNGKSEYLESSFQDIPRDEPELVDALLHPWPDRTLLFRLGHALTATATTQKSSMEQT